MIFSPDVYQMVYLSSDAAAVVVICERFSAVSCVSDVVTCSCVSDVVTCSSMSDVVTSSV